MGTGHYAQVREAWVLGGNRHYAQVHEAWVLGGNRHYAQVREAWVLGGNRHYAQAWVLGGNRHYAQVTCTMLKVGFLFVLSVPVPFYTRNMLLYRYLQESNLTTLSS